MTHDIGATAIRTTDQAADQRARMLQLAGEVADARAQARRHEAEMQTVRGQREKLRVQLADVEVRNYELEHQVLTLFGPAAGGQNASIAKETHTGAAAEPVAGADQAAAAMAAESAQKFAEAERSVAARAGTVVADLAVKIDTSQIDLALAKVAELKLALESKKCQISPANQERIINAACALAANGGQAAQIKSTYAALIEVVNALTSPTDRS